MATTVARLEAVLSAQTRDFDRAMDRSHTKTQRLGRAAGVAGLAIFAGLGVTAKRGFDEIAESQKVMAQTEAGIKSTGGVAKVTAKDISGLSDSLSRMSGIDDEVIQQGANLLLTFTKIHNEAGRGNDIFNRATAAALDLSVRGFGSLDAMSKQLGKALNDPIKGLTGLSRAGVQFSAEQRNMITAMVESGNVLGAQKVIMAEVETQVGGSAKAYGQTLPGQIAKARNAFDEVAGRLMVAMLPALTSLIEKLSTALSWLQRHPGAAQAMAVGLGVLGAALLTAQLRMLALNLAFAVSPIGALVISLAALTAALVIAYNRNENFRESVHKLNDAFKILSDIRGPSGIDVIRKIAGAFQHLANWIQRALNALKGLLDKLSDIKGPSGLDLIRGLGDPRDAFMVGPPGAGTGPTDISPKLWDELAGARQFGLRLTSGYRPGAITRSGHPSDHGVYPSKAIDVAGSSGAMAGFFRWLIGQRDVKQAFYDPLGSIFGGILSSYREGGHSDHVHVATYDKGGWLKPGLTLAMNNTGRSEPVGGQPFMAVINIAGEHVADVLFDPLRRKAQVFERNNQRPAFGS